METKRQNRNQLLIVLLFGGAFFLCGVSQKQTVLGADDPIGHWPGEGNAFDASGNGNDGTLMNGVTFDDGIIGQAFSLDGMDDYVELPTGVALATPQDITMSAWIKLGGSKPDAEIVRRGTDMDYVPGQDGWGATLALRSNQIVFAVVVPNPGLGYPWVQRSVSYPAPITLDQWHHVVGVRSGTIIEAWVDGSPVSNDMLIAGPLRGTGRSLIGYEQWSVLDLHFDGLIDEVAIYDRALYESEILSLFSSGVGQTIQELVDKVMALNLQQGIDSSLDGKLDAALNALDDVNASNNVAAIGALEAFVNAVQAQSGKQITETDADDLIADAMAIIDLLIGL